MFSIMIPRRVGLVLPAALALVVVTLPTATAVAPPYEPVTIDDPVVVGEAGDLNLYGLEVGPRTIAWGGGLHAGPVPSPSPSPSPSTAPGEDLGAAVAQSGAQMRSRLYTPDLGKAALSLGDMTTAPVVAAIDAATTDEWAVGFDPLGPSYVLRVRHQGGPEMAAELATDDFGPGSGSVAIWGDMALVGPNLVDLDTLESVDLGTLDECIAGENAVLADGLLLVQGLCEGGQTFATEVPEDGLDLESLDSLDWDVVLDFQPDLMAYSRGLLVFADSKMGLYGYLRLDDPDAEPWAATIPAGIDALRVQGHRYVVVAARDGDVVAGVFEEGGEAPVAVVPLDGGLGMAPVLFDEGAAATAAVVIPRDESSEMNLDGIAIDLYGRTLAWSDGEDVFAATLPPLAGGAVTSTAPATGKAGAPVAVSAAGLQPGEEVAVWLESDPVLLTLGRAAADGTFAASVTLPAGTAGGTHSLTVHGVESGWTSVRSIALAAAATGNPGLRVDTGR